MSTTFRSTFENSIWIDHRSGSDSQVELLKSRLESQLSLRLNTSQSLEEAAYHISSSPPYAVFYVLDSSSDQHLESFDKWMSASLPMAGLVLVCEGFSQSELQKFSKLSKLSSFLDLTLDHEAIEQALSRVHQVVSGNLKKSRVAESLKVQNKQLETMNESLERIVKERTADIQEKKNQIEVHVNKVKALLSFIKELSKVGDIGDLCHLVRTEVQSIAKSGEPYLAVHAGGFGNWIYTIHQGQLIEKSVSVPWQEGVRIRINDYEDKKYLANQFSKPIQKLFAIPLSHSDGQASRVTLFIEHNLDSKESDELLDEIGKRAQSLSLCLDRSLLEIELKRSAFLWESTFDSIEEPIVITDEKLELIRANKPFLNRLSGWFKDSGSMRHLDPIVQSFQSSRSSLKQLRYMDQFYDWSTYPILNANGNKVESVVSLFVDTTGERRLQSQMIQHEKMTAMGHLAGNIAHELNNPLAGLTSLCQIVLSEIETSSPHKEDLQEILLASKRSSEIIKNLLDFSNPTEQNSMELIDLNDLIRKTLPLLKSITSSFRRQIEFSEAQVPVRVNPQLLQQVLFNLVNNACQAMGDSGELSILTQRKETEAYLIVKDTGCGIQEENLDSIFEPFFSTKLDAGGTGIGLSMSRNIVRSYGGDISVVSKSGEGTRFEVSLPVVEDGSSIYSQ